MKDKARILVMGGGINHEIQYAGGDQVYIGYGDPKAAEAAAHENIHALILTGGQDISPLLYGQKPGKFTQRPSGQRDLAEVTALQAAVKRGIPVLGICRGAQLINAALGGTLHQHLGAEKATKAHRFHYGHDHRIDLEEGSHLQETMQVSQPMVVSIHHQAVNRIAPGLRVAARGLDGIIEAIESEDGMISGVQFHPEISTNDVTQRIFDQLVKRAATKAGLPKPVARPKFVQVSTAVRPVLRPALEPRLTGWTCFRCQVQFDERIDHVDHMYFLHGIDLIENMSDDEISQLVLDEEVTI